MTFSHISGRYKLLDTIGEGGMAIVYRAEDLILDRVVAVKVLRSEFSQDDEFILRFRREAESATSLAHPNIVTIYDVGEEDDLYYIVMEYVEGRTLKDYIKDEAPLANKKALEIMKQIASAIRHAHDHHIIHRDIKPHNILITHNGDVKVTDFGIAMAMTSATITHTKSVIGSAHYFSPEQAKGSIANEKSDIYSLGVVLYEMLTGSLPFSGESPVSVALKHLQDKFTPPKQLNRNIPQSVENIIYKAMEKDPLNRYDSVKELQDDLELALEPTLVHEAPYTPRSVVDESTKVLSPINLQNNDQASDSVEGNGKKRKKRKRLLLTTIIFLVLFAGIVSAFTWIPGLFYVEDVAVPDVTDMLYDDAVALLEEHQLQVEREEEFNDEVEEDRVIRQDPSPDTMVKANSPVTLVVSLGKEEVELENYEGKMKDSVERLLSSEDFKDIEWIPEESDQVEGLILSQTPKAGEKVVIEDTIMIFRYSSGPEPIVLENLIGMTKETVDTYAANHELNVNYSEQHSDHMEAGRVISQNPSPFEEISRGETIDIVLSKGKKPQEPPRNGPITFEVSQPIEIEDGREFQVVIRYQDANTDNGVAVNEKISESKTYTFPLTVNPNGEASYQVYLDGEEVRTKTYSYKDAENLE